MSKSNTIGFWRIIFTLMMLTFHFDNTFLLITPYVHHNGWYIGVEFFFIVSGFLLYKKATSENAKEDNGLSYTVNRFKGIYPYYLAAIILSLFIFLVFGGRSFGDIANLVGSNIFEVFALHGIGLDLGWDGINNADWFISVMLISGLILYHGLKKWRNTFENLIAPLIIIVCFSFLYRNMYSIGGSIQTTGFYENWGLMRALADMCLGVMSAKIYDFIMAKKAKTILPRIMGVIGFVFVIIMSFDYGGTKLDFIYAIILMFSVATAFLPIENTRMQKFFTSKVVGYLAGLTMCMYLVHDNMRTMVMPYFFGYPTDFKTKLLLLLVFFCLVTAVAAVVKILVDTIVKLCKRMCEQK